MTTGERIRDARKKQKLTQAELGFQCGLVKQSINKYETGQIQNIPIDTLKRISKALGVSVSYLVDSDDSTNDITPIYSALNEQGRAELCSYGEFLLNKQERSGAHVD